MCPMWWDLLKHADHQSCTGILNEFLLTEAGIKAHLLYTVIKCIVVHVCASKVQVHT